MRGFITGVIVTLLVFSAGAFLFLYLGKFPVGADNPPGKMERSLANMAVDQHVDRNAPKQANPMQPTVENLTAGARLYEQHCALCHGGAAQRVSPMRNRFNPPVPQIINRVPHDPDANLFWVTKHGTRMTGMPYWDRLLSDAQIWQIVAFIKNSGQLPPEVQAAWQQAGAAAPARQNSSSASKRE